MTGAAVALGADVSEDGQHAAVGAGWREAGGDRIVAELAWYGRPAAAVAALAGLCEARDPVVVVVDGRSAAGALLKPLADLGILAREPSAQDVAAAHAEFLGLVNGRRLHHLEQEPLTAAVRAARQRPLAGAKAWERGLTVDQSPLVACTFAVWGFCRWLELAQPGN